MSARARPFSLYAAVFGIALAWLGTYYLRGDLGRYSDDWSISMVDPVLGHPRWNTWPFERNYFWRPVLQVFLHYTFAALWNRMWLFHTLNVLAHGVAAALLYRLQAVLGLEKRAALAGALVFLLFPFNYEVVFWSTAMTTGIPAGLAIILALLACRYAMSPRPGLAPLMGLWTFFIMCWYEQPGVIVATLPCAYMAVRREGEPLRRSITNIAWMLAWCGAALVLYVALLRVTAPANARGGAGSFIGAHEIAGRWAEFRSAMRWYYTERLTHAWLGGIAAGWERLSSFTGVLSAGATAMAGGIFFAAWVREPLAARSADPAVRRVQTARWCWVFLFAAGTTVAAWLPIFPIRGQILEARSHYFVGVGLGPLVATLLHGALRATRRWRWWAVLDAAAAAGVALGGFCGAVCLLGWQTNMQNRSRADAAQTHALAERVGTVAPGTVFLLLDDQYASGHTGWFFFDRVLLGWAMKNWSSTTALRAAMKRDDVFATPRNFWVVPEYQDCDSRGYRFIEPLSGAGTPDPAGGVRLTWEQSVPYIIKADGSIEVFSRLSIKRGGEPPFTVESPRARGGGEYVLTVAR